MGDGATNYTYHNDVNCRYSLIDYFLSSPELIAEQNGKVSILLDGDNLSDHLAILWSANIVRPATKSQVAPNRHLKLNWSKLRYCQLPICSIYGSI